MKTNNDNIAYHAGRVSYNSSTEEVFDTIEEYIKAEQYTFIRNSEEATAEACVGHFFVGSGKIGWKISRDWFCLRQERGKSYVLFKVRESFVG